MFILIKVNKDNKFEFLDDCSVWGWLGIIVNFINVFKDNKLKIVVIK